MLIVPKNVGIFQLVVEYISHKNRIEFSMSGCDRVAKPYKAVPLVMKKEYHFVAVLVGIELIIDSTFSVVV